jgi:hypothetical protein
MGIELDVAHVQGLVMTIEGAVFGNQTVKLSFMRSCQFVALGNDCVIEDDGHATPLLAN